MAKRLILLFNSTHYALKAERAATDAGLTIKMIPVPRGLSAACNMGMEVKMSLRDSVQKALSAASVDATFVLYED